MYKKSKKTLLKHAKSMAHKHGVQAVGGGWINAAKCLALALGKDGWSVVDKASARKLVVELVGWPEISGPLKKKRKRRARFSKEYLDYIASAAWRTFRKGILKLRGAFCERCSSALRLELHHLSYERLGRELPEDVVILCRDCHQKAHGRKHDTLGS